MSAFEALRLVRLRRPEYPDMDFRRLADLIRKIEADGASHDYEAAVLLEPVVVPDALPDNALAFYQHCVEASIYTFQPVWGRIITLGRKKFVQKLSRDEVQCFDAGGLLIDPPTDEIIAWWDRIAAHARRQGDEVRLARAREAEQMSLRFESERIANLGINEPVVWTSIEDNTAGYDILSYDLGQVGSVVRLIEVKSTIVSPLRFILTRNEWNTAIKFGAAYHFHIWDMTTRRLHERTAAQIAPHVPKDNEKGRWKDAEIPLSS
jgi:hypothetical protein